MRVQPFTTPTRSFTSRLSLGLLVLAAVLLGSVRPVAAEQTPVLDLSLEELLDVRVVAAASREQRPFDSPRSISVLTAIDLQRRNYKTTPDALRELVGVMVQQTNDGAGSPILRGLVGNQVLLMVDGIRMNNAIYRLGPNQYLSTVDINQIERIEVIRGPGSVLFGSDALGGIINIVTKSRAVGEKEPSAVEVFGRLGSGDRGTTGRIGFAGGADRLGVVGGVSLKPFGQLRGGGDTIQPFTGYDEWDADLKVAVKPRTGHRLTFSAQRVDQTGVQRADLLQAGTELEDRWDPELRTLFSGEWTATQRLGFVREAQAVGYYQDQSERTFRIMAATPTDRRRFDDGDRTLGARVQLFSVWGQHNLTYGAEFNEDKVRSTRIDQALATGVLTPQRGTFADGARTKSEAAYIQDQVDVTRRLNVELGARLSRTDLDSTLADPSTGTVAIDTKNRGLVGSAYGLFKISESLRLVGGASQGFRAPNVDDVSILGSFGGGFEVPNPFLKPEHSINTVAGLKYASPRAMGTASIFEAFYHNLVARGPATFNGLPFLDTNSDGVGEPSEPLVFKRQNVGQARVKGVELDGQLRVSDGWTLGGNLAWISGRDISAQQPLRRMPPLHGTARLLYESAPRWWVEGYSLFAQDQHELNAGDITDVRIGPDGTPGFAIVNFRGGVAVPRVGTLTLGIENVADVRYKWHGSGIEGPGRNVVVGLRRTF